MKLQPFRKNCEGRKKTVRVECECITTGMTMTFLKKKNNNSRICKKETKFVDQSGL